MSNSIIAKWPGTCAECGAHIPAGAEARYYGRNRMYGTTCHEQQPRNRSERRAARPTFATTHDARAIVGIALASFAQASWRARSTGTAAADDNWRKMPGYTAVQEFAYGCKCAARSLERWAGQYVAPLGPIIGWSLAAQPRATEPVQDGCYVAPSPRPHVWKWYTGGKTRRQSVQVHYTAPGEDKPTGARGAKLVPLPLTPEEHAMAGNLTRVAHAIGYALNIWAAPNPFRYAIYARDYPNTEARETFYGKPAPKRRTLKKAA